MFSLSFESPALSNLAERVEIYRSAMTAGQSQLWEVDKNRVKHDSPNRSNVFDVIRYWWLILSSKIFEFEKTDKLERDLLKLSLL